MHQQEKFYHLQHGPAHLIIIKSGGNNELESEGDGLKEEDFVSACFEY